MLYHMWKIVITMRGKDGSAHGYLNLYCGGMELCNETEYNSMCKINPLKYSSGDYFTMGGGTYSSDSAFVAGEKPSNWRGDTITILNGNYSCYTPVD